ncbi:MAG: RNA polymerase sigma factor [Treponema sp.]|nr:RNA polymerase sigma factor [Treponema sp.]
MEISQELIETVFLYAYKRVSNYEEARDLAQEIIFEAFLETKRNTVRKNFYGWLWAMAHNKYVDFLRRKNHEDISFNSSPESVIENPTVMNFNSIESVLIDNEEIENLYQSVERLSKVHRETIIRFYLRNQSISEISCALEIPSGTVKRRLFDARKQMRKFMNEEKPSVKIKTNSTFDPFSIDVFYWNAAAPAMHALTQKFSDQIAASCAREPKSIEELAVELRVDSSYLAEPIEKMLEAPVLVKTDDEKFLTDFNLIPEGLWKSWYLARRKLMNDLEVPTQLYECILKNKERIMKAGYNLNQFSFEYLLWYFVALSGPLTSELIEEIAVDYFKDEIPKSYTRKKFGVFGEYFPKSKAEPIKEGEHYELEDDEIMVGCFEYESSFWFNFLKSERSDLAHLHMAFPWLDVPEPLDASFQNGKVGLINSENYYFFREIALNPDYEISSDEEEFVARLLEQNLLKKIDGKFYANIPVFSKADFYEIRWLLKESFRPVVKAVFEKFVAEIRRIIVPNLRKDLIPTFFDSDISQMFNFQSSLYNYCKENRLCEIPEGYANYTGGVALIFHEQFFESGRDGK